MTVVDDVEAPDGPQKLAVQVARKLEREILERRWPVGELLGSETELRERFGVSRAVLREAVRLLEHQEVATMRRGPGGGLVVCAPNPSHATRAFVIYLEYVGTSIEHLVRARRLLEPLAARLAAEVIDEDDIAALRALARPPGGATDAELADGEFHVVLGRLSGNAVLQIFMEVLTRLTVRHSLTARRPSPDETAAVRATSARRHVEIVDAVIAGDAVAAQERLSAHLGEVEAWLASRRLRQADEPMSTRPVDPSPGESHAVKLGELVAARIHDDITGDGRQVGEVLGSETELLARYGVSRAALREAVRILEHHNVARMRRGPGGGLVILAPDPTAAIHTMALYLDHRGLRSRDLREVREVMEVGCVQAIAADPARTDLVDRLRRAVGEPDTFHATLAELARNPVLTLFLRVVTEFELRHGSPDRPRRTPEAARPAHEAVVAALVAGDDGLAQHRIRRHLHDPAR
ncbi:MAG: hypothetical protein ABS81_05785 [Pseudonocardia sp. SCN 72-86]|mgnify:CR=1 FL=1|nr:MAG: hypothetical protein ABS81_05785 [Pseudonocardia sp. SCN 72-86]